MSDARTLTEAERLLRAGKSVRETVATTGASRRAVTALRDHLALPVHPPGHTPATTAEVIAARTRPGSDGHLLWTGPKRPDDSVPLVHHQGAQRTAYHLVWYLHTGAWPSGILRITCDEPGCVAFEHLLETPHLTMADSVTSLDKLRQMIDDRTEPDEPGGHIRWTGYIRAGIPVMRYGTAEEDKQTTAARFVWYLHTGREPRGTIRRTCRYPACMAFQHLTDTKKDTAS